MNIVIKIATLLGGLAFLFACTTQADEPEKWVVYYDGSLPFEDFLDYDVIAFDTDYYPAFEEKRREGQVILGYLSTTEGETYRPYYKDIEALDVFIGKSDLWENHLIIDIREKSWRDYFIHTLIPTKIIDQGFDGIMLDTIDTVLYLEEQYPQKFSGMKQAAVRFIAEMRLAHPKLKLMINRGIQISKWTAPYVDYLLAESVRVDYDFDTHKPGFFPKMVYQEYVEAIKAAQKANPALKVVSLDYWTMSEEDPIKAIYAEQRSHGFIPYVTTVDLKKHHPEPK